MADTSSNRLEKNIPKIMDAWAIRANNEVEAAHHQHDLALKNSLPDYLKELSEALSKTIDRTSKKIEEDKKTITRVSKKHGKSRVKFKNYTMEQLISEYHILRQVICEELEKEAPLTTLEREVIVGSIETAVSDAASEFSLSMRTLQEQMTHTIAHDLRAPITIARAASELIMRRPDDKIFLLEKAKQVRNNMDRIEKMISDLLDVSRIQAGEGVLNDFQEFNLDELVRKIAEETNLAIEGKVVVQSDGECIGNWYEDGVRRSIENLISNAIKYGNENSPVKINLSQDKNSATISVHNEGDPIPEEELNSLFQKFKRSSTSEGKAGWGLGLTVVECMIEAHGGTVTVQSDTDDGTSFILNLPKTQPDKSKSDPTHKASGTPRDATVNH